MEIYGIKQEGHWCEKCKQFVSPITGKLTHPDLGERTCNVCPKCGCMVYLKKEAKDG
jgi:hypothetical protein